MEEELGGSSRRAIHSRSAGELVEGKGQSKGNHTTTKYEVGKGVAGVYIPDTECCVMCEASQAEEHGVKRLFIKPVSCREHIYH